MIKLTLETLKEIKIEKEILIVETGNRKFEIIKLKNGYRMFITFGSVFHYKRLSAENVLRIVNDELDASTGFNMRIENILEKGVVV